MDCKACNFKELEEKKFIGIFTRGNSFMTTEGDECGLFACPECGTVKMVTDKNYIKKRKEQYKND